MENVRRHQERSPVSLEMPVLEDSSPGGQSQQLHRARLSYERSTGSETVVCFIRPDAQPEELFAFDTEFELFVLSGSIKLGGEDLLSGDYIYGTYVVNNCRVQSRSGAVLLIFARAPASDATEVARLTQVMTRVSAVDLDWSQISVHSPAGVLYRATLRYEKSRNHGTFLYRQEPGRGDGMGWEWNPYAAEWFDLTDMVYTFRPPGIPHETFMRCVEKPKRWLVKSYGPTVRNLVTRSDAVRMWEQVPGLDRHVMDGGV